MSLTITDQISWENRFNSEITESNLDKFKNSIDDKRFSCSSVGSQLALLTVKFVKSEYDTIIGRLRLNAAKAVVSTMNPDDFALLIGGLVHFGYIFLINL